MKNFFSCFPPAKMATLNLSGIINILLQCLLIEYTITVFEVEFIHIICFHFNFSASNDIFYGFSFG